MKKIHISLIFIFGVLSCFGQKTTPSVSEKEVYEFLSSYFGKKNSAFKLYSQPLLFRNEQVDLRSDLNFKFLNENNSGRNQSPIKIDTVLSQADLNFMKEQIRNPSIKYWKQSSFKRSEVKIMKKDKRKLEERWYPEFETFYITIPLFSIDKKTCLLYQIVLSGPEKAGGHIIIFSLVKNNEWEWLTTVPVNGN